MLISDVTARAVYDSNGSPTVEVEILAGDTVRHAELAPRGSTTGDFEAHVLEDAARYPGLAAVNPALDSVTRRVRPALIGLDVTDQRGVDVALRGLDDDPTLSTVGGNVTVAASMAAAWAGAACTGQPLYRHLAGHEPDGLPVPMFNIADGAVGSTTVWTEFLLLPLAADPVEALDQGVRVRRALADRLGERGHRCADSTQGGWSLDLGSCEATMDAVLIAAQDCGLRPGDDVALGLDLSGAEFSRPGGYAFGWLSAPVGLVELIDRYADWVNRYPLIFLEDPFAPEDTEAWRALMTRMGGRAAVVGDDLFASSAQRIAAGVDAGLADGALVKPNQVGTVSEALDALTVGRERGIQTVVSQRSGENGGALITHLAVAGRAAWLKAGGMSRMDRVAKYNELLRIAARTGPLPANGRPAVVRPATGAGGRP
jgi:enolase